MAFKGFLSSLFFFFLQNVPVGQVELIRCNCSVDLINVKKFSEIRWCEMTFKTSWSNGVRESLLLCVYICGLGGGMLCVNLLWCWNHLYSFYLRARTGVKRDCLTHRTQTLMKPCIRSLWFFSHRTRRLRIAFVGPFLTACTNTKWELWNS